MSDIGITEDFEGSGYKFEIWFRRRTSGESYVLQAQNSDVKKWWVRDITKLLWSQAIKNRGNNTIYLLNCYWVDALEINCLYFQKDALKGNGYTLGDSSVKNSFGFLVNRDLC